MMESTVHLQADYSMTIGWERIATDDAFVVLRATQAVHGFFDNLVVRVTELLEGELDFDDMMEDIRLNIDAQPHIEWLIDESVENVSHQHKLSYRFHDPETKLTVQQDRLVIGAVIQGAVVVISLEGTVLASHPAGMDDIHAMMMSFSFDAAE